MANEPQRDPDPEPQQDPEPESGASSIWQRFRRTRWGELLTVTGTVMAAVAAITGLWFQAVATYWSQQTAKDQLTQSKEANEEQTRQQAAKVTFWREGRQGYWGAPRYLYLVNRSPDPVTAVNMLLGGTDGSNWRLAIGVLRPCSETVISGESLVLAKSLNTDPGHPPRPIGVTQAKVWFPLELHFSDRNGVIWSRREDRLKQWSSEVNPHPKQGEFMWSTKEPQVKKSQDCALE